MWPSFQRDATKPQEKKKEKGKKKKKKKRWLRFAGETGRAGVPHRLTQILVSVQQWSSHENAVLHAPFTSWFCLLFSPPPERCHRLDDSHLEDSWNFVESCVERTSTFFFPLSFPIHDRSPFRLWSACRPDSCNTRTRIIIAIII